MNAKYSVELVGVFHTGTLYDGKGRKVFDAETACEAAEEVYGDQWSSVFNGQYGVTREDWKAGEI